MRHLVSTLILLIATAATGLGATYADYPIQGVPFSAVRLTDAFWAPRISQNQTTTIPIATDQCYSTGRVANFLKAAAILEGRNIGWFGTDLTFDDTDIYKLLEGMAYSYTTNPSPVLRDSMDHLIGIVAAAQEPDGYLMTARTAAQPGHMHAWLGAERWTKDPDLSHELYNAGHLFEAAAAHYQATGQTTLLHVATRLADLLVAQFLRGGLAYEPGHQIVEMGLVKLYRATGREDYLQLAKYFLDIRGVGGPGSLRTEYCQSHQPPALQREAVGHAVRATYMYSGMADVAAIMADRSYRTAIDAIWHDIVEKKYYITGGIGARHNGEAFGDAYELPNLSAYNETCAAIANVYWNWRMFLLSGESKYYDVLERTLYNGVLAGISLAGDRFFYPNPLESRGSYKRSEWFGCACCPSNLCRFMASVPGYIYAHRADSVYVNLFAEGKATIQLDDAERAVTLSQHTQYPWQGQVSISIDDLQGASELALMIRLPGWAAGRPVPSNLYTYLDATTASGVSLALNGQPATYTMHQGYMVLKRAWQKGDVLTLNLPMPVRRVVAHQAVADDHGRVALERGPIVYCLEWVDNDNQVFSSIVPDDAEIEVIDDPSAFAAFGTQPPLLRIHGRNKVFGPDDRLTSEPRTFTAIPYYTWANRGEGNMAVWLARTEAQAEASLDVVAHTDTLHMALTQTATTGTYGQGYPSQIYPTDRFRISEALGIGYSQMRARFGSDITYALVEPNGSINMQSTAAAPGHWMAADGHAVAWVSNPSATTNEADVPRIFSEFQKDKYYLQIGQYPQLCPAGQQYRFRQALTYAEANKPPRRVVFDVKLTITDDAGAFDGAVRYAQTFLTDEAYADVAGTPRQQLQTAIAAKPTGSSAYAASAKAIYSALATFIESKLDAEEAALKERLIDEVDAGESASETAHNGKYVSGSNTGTYAGETWRDTPAKGYVQYTLANTRGTAEGLWLNMRFTTNDAGRSGIVTVGGHRLCELYVPTDIKGKQTGGMYEVFYPIPAAFLQEADGTVKPQVNIRFTATGNASIPGLFYLRLLSGADITPYRFLPADWQSGDTNRLPADAVTCTDEGIVIAAGQGRHDVCLSLNTAATDYSVLGDAKYLVVKGRDLSIDSDASQLWWLNGINKGSAEAPAFVKTAPDGESVIAWDLSKSALNANCRGHFWNVSTGFTCFGLTSTSGTSVVTYIGFTDDINAFFDTVGINDAIGRGAPGTRLPPSACYDLAGRRASPSQPGIYVTAGRKIAVK